MDRRSKGRGDFKVPLRCSPDDILPVDNEEICQIVEHGVEASSVDVHEAACGGAPLPDPSTSSTEMVNLITNTTSQDDDADESGSNSSQSSSSLESVSLLASSTYHLQKPEVSLDESSSSLESAHLVPTEGDLGKSSQECEDNDVIYVGSTGNITGPLDYCKEVAPRSEPFGTGFVKAKRVHMESQACQNLLETIEGVAPLKNPSTVLKSSKDPNRGMYPGGRRKGLHQLPQAPADPSKGFVKASNLGPALPSAAQFLNASDRNAIESNNLKYGRNSSSGTEQRGRKRKIQEQGNTLQNYFSRSPKKGPNSGSDSASNSPVKSSHPSSKCIPGPSSDTKTTLAWDVTLPDLPSLNPSAAKGKTLEPSKLKSSAGKRKLATARKNTDITLIGPEAHNLFKATFLYDKELAKPDTKTTGDKYGLLGTGTPPPSTPPDSPFDLLAYELIENIFCRLPMMDLLLNMNKVCKRWNEVISRPQFLPWKKRYHRVKKDISGDVKYVRQLRQDHGMICNENFLMQLIRYMKNFKVLTSREMDDVLQQHPMYQCARAIFEERITDCLTADKSPNPWCMITLLVYLSEYVKDIQQIYILLLGPSSQCTAYAVIECLYCINTFLLSFKKLITAASWNGMHYRLYYALYLLENESETTSDQLENAANHGKKTGQRSLHNYRPSEAVQMTHEQLRICNHNVENGQIVKIIAFAGTGKTSTLVKYTRLRPNLRFLLVVYNKSVQVHASKVFPPNVTCKTGHSLAWTPDGVRFRASGKLKQSSLKVYNILKSYKVIKGEPMYVQAKFVIDTLNNFMASADPFITTAHVPESRVGETGKLTVIDHQQKMHFSEQAANYWEKMINLRNDVSVSHDTYLKTYQLSKPKISSYDIILIDEAQDMTPALADVLLSQDKAKILVGDPHQQIYAFRGAVNAMQMVPATHTYYLTQSFRFGSEIAFVASSVLDLLKREKKTLVGNASTGSVRGETSGQIAIITRSNFSLFKEAVVKCCYSDFAGKVAFVGGTYGFGFDRILDIYALMLRFSPSNSGEKFQREIKDLFIKSFSNIGELEKYATKTMDMEMLGKIRIVRAYTHALPSLINKIKAKCINDTDLADIVLSTAHKSKGLEFNTVMLTDDYLSDVPMRIGPIPDDEANILYVAVTRAKKCLLMTPTLTALLKRAGQQFLYPVSSKKLLAAGKSFKCMGRDVDFEACAATLVKRAVSMPERKEEEDKVASPSMVSMEMASLKELYGTYPPTEEEESEEEEEEEVDMMVEQWEEDDDERLYQDEEEEEYGSDEEDNDNFVGWWDCPSFIPPCLD